MRTRARPFHSIALALALFSTGCGGGGGNDGGGPLPTECIDVSGRWLVTETAQLDCSGFLEDFVPSTVSGSGTIEIEQDGCAIRYTMPQVGVERSGYVDGDFIHLSGPIAVIPSGVPGLRVRANELTIEGVADPATPSQLQLSGTGTLSVTVEGEGSSCAASSTATFRR
jgi:hypothetical protein